MGKIARGLFSQNCPIKLCYSWLIACKHLIKVLKIADKLLTHLFVYFRAGPISFRADFKLVGNLGLIGPAVTGILQCNVINHAITFENNKKKIASHKKKSNESIRTRNYFILFLLTIFFSFLN